MSNSCLELIREEDFVEYFLFPPINDNNEDEEKLNHNLENLLKQINQIVEEYKSDYIWHKDKFTLNIRKNAHQTFLEENNDAKEILPPHLYGLTHFGDNIQDQWFIVFLLFEISKQIPELAIRVVDADEEFLLIEAANVLPKWVTPDTSEQRVYIYDGHLHLIQDSQTPVENLLPVAIGIKKLNENRTNYRVSNEIQNVINERLKQVLEEKAHSIHRQVIRVPIGVAAILQEKPSLIAPACLAFCNRDPIDMKACRAMRFFPPEDQVRINVKFTRCLYAMIINDEYVPDKRIGWNLPVAKGSEEYKESILGVKIACGFEILALQAKEDDNLENDHCWRSYLKTLHRKGYFNENIEGSKEYKQLLDEAILYYKQNLSNIRSTNLLGREIKNLLKNLDINSDDFHDVENNLIPSESDDWLNISPDELNEMLTAKYGIKKLYSLNGKVDTKEFTKNIDEFLEKKSEFDGIQNDETPSTSTANSPTAPAQTKAAGIKKNESMRRAMNDNQLIHEQSSTKSNKCDQKINFEPDSFVTHVKNFLDFVIPEDNWESNSDMSDYEDDNDLEKNIDDMTNTKMTVDTDMEDYMKHMDQQLSQTKIGKTFQQAKSSSNDNKNRSEDDFDDIESFEPIDIDVNALKNIMDSYKSQIGGPGPASSLLNAMGIGMSRTQSSNEIKDDLSESTV